MAMEHSSRLSRSEYQTQQVSDRLLENVREHDSRGDQDNGCSKE